MTVDEMAECIVRTVNNMGGGVTFAEIVNAIGSEANGDRQLGRLDLNVVLWSGVSEAFVDAFTLAKSRIYPVQTQFLVYAMDGALLNLPIAKQLNKPYKKTHWLPVVFSSRPAKQGKRLSNSRIEAARKMN